MSDKPNPNDNFFQKLSLEIRIKELDDILFLIDKEDSKYFLPLEAGDVFCMLEERRKQLISELDKLTA